MANSIVVFIAFLLFSALIFLYSAYSKLRTDYKVTISKKDKYIRLLEDRYKILEAKHKEAIK